MKLTPLKYSEGSAGSITVVCKATGRKAIWNEAVSEGWQADLDGEPFNAYYSPESYVELLQPRVNAAQARTEEAQP